MNKFYTNMFKGWYYFRRGHGTYLTLLLTFANFVIIQYVFLISKYPFFQKIFPSLTWFTIIFTISYIFLSGLLGYIDKRKKVLNMEMSLTNDENPYNKMFLERFDNIDRKLKEIENDRT